MLWEVPGSIGEDFGMFERRTKKNWKNQVWNWSQRGTRAVLDLHCEGTRTVLTRKEEDVDRVEHGPCHFYPMSNMGRVRPRNQLLAVFPIFHITG